MVPREYSVWSNMGTVVVNENENYEMIRIGSSAGFQPHILSIKKGSSVLWYWKETDEYHNVYRVEPPDEKVRFVNT